MGSLSREVLYIPNVIIGIVNYTFGCVNNKDLVLCVYVLYQIKWFDSVT